MNALETGILVDVVSSPDEAKAKGYAPFNAGKHVLVAPADPGERFTVSVALPGGQTFTAAFLPKSDGSGHHCVDVQVIRPDNPVNPANGSPTQDVIVFAGGRDAYRFDNAGQEKNPPTLTTILLEPLAVTMPKPAKAGA